MTYRVVLSDPQNYRLAPSVGDIGAEYFTTVDANKIVSRTAVIGIATFTQTITGTATTAIRSRLVDTNTAPSGTFYPGLFANNSGTISTSIYVDSEISYSTSTNTLSLGELGLSGANVTTTSANVSLFNTNATKVNALGDATSIVVGSTSGIATIRNSETHLLGDVLIGGNDIKASDGNVNITLTSNTLTEVKGDLKVSGNTIKSSTGDTVLTLNSTDAVFSDDLTVQGNLVVEGFTTEVNKVVLKVDDRTIDLGLVDGVVPPTATTWDLGVLFNYNSSGAKKSALVWKNGDFRFKFATEITSSGGGSGTNSPQITVTNFAPIEISSLWINGCGALGAKEVIQCSGTEITLQDITIDAGTY